MEYLTKYSLSVTIHLPVNNGIKNCPHMIPTDAKFCPECGKPKGFDPSSIIRKIIRDYPEAECAIDPNGNSVGETQWYQHEADIKRFSTVLPDILFELRGLGEERDDVWIKWFLGGKMQAVRAKAKIVFPAFDPNGFI